MRTEEEVIAQILHVANTNDNIRAVLLTGSRVNPNTVKDRFSDFDIIYIVTQLGAFIQDSTWIDVFGERLIWQLPDEMTIGQKDDHAFHYLMRFKDGNRIDLTLFPLDKLNSAFKRSSLTSLLLDKDNLFGKLPPPDETDYLIKRPAEKEFIDCCNEFWWVSTYIAKGLCREEMTYAKEMMEIPVRAMFLKIIEWHIGVETAFTVSFGQGGRNMKGYISPLLYEKILLTYADAAVENTWKSLFLMAALFDELARQIAAALKFNYNNIEAKNVREYLEWSYKIPKGI